MISLTSLAFSLLASFSVQPSPPAPPLPVITVPAIDTPEQKARRDRVEACQRAFYGQTYLPQPAIFRIADADTELFLFGSIHALPPGFDWRSPQLDGIVKRADKLVTENGVDPSNVVRTVPLPAAQPQPQPAHPPLRDRLQGERRAKWIGMKAVGPASIMTFIDRQSDWRAAMTILNFSSGVGQTRLGGGVEVQLLRDFRSAKKPLAGLEQNEDVLASLNAMPAAVQRTMLNQSIDLVGETSRAGDFMNMFHRWARGESVVEPLESSLPNELRELILDRRNAAWVPEIRKLLRPAGTRLVVVGAGHLYGRNNLLDLLAAAGMKAERISRTEPPLPRPAFTPQPKSLAECMAYFRPAPPPPTRPAT